MAASGNSGWAKAVNAFSNMLNGIFTAANIKGAENQDSPHIYNEGITVKETELNISPWFYMGVSILILTVAVVLMVRR